MQTSKNNTVSANLFELYIPLVKKTAKKLARRLPSHVELDDLVSAGFVGLTEAVRRYDAKRPEGFESYVQKRVAGAIRDELRTLDPLTRDQRRQVRQVQKAERALSQDLGRAAERGEVADALGIEIADVDRIRETQMASTPVVVDMGSEKDDAEDLLSSAVDAGQVSAETQAAEREDVLRVAQAIESLPERLRTVLALYYQDGLLLKEIGAVMGFSEARACQLHGEAVTRLRSTAKAA
jgi:RNA polymerase sigma factor for flagellar operon FliA